MGIRKLSLRGAILLGALCAAGALWVGLRAQDQKAWKTEIPPRLAPPCCGYPFPRSTDAEIADSDVHRVLYDDTRVMLLEVNNPPGLNIYMHGHPYASVFAHDSSIGPAAPGQQPPYASGDAHLDANTSYNDMGSNDAPPPQGLQWPTCTDSGPQAPHRPYDANVAPNHFYRLEFLRLDGEDIQTRWKEWYPEMTQPEKAIQDPTPGPALGPKFSDAWPYPLAYDSIQAAPNNYKLLFEDGKIRLLEVFIRPGETTPMHGSPYPAVLAFNSIPGHDADVTEKFLDAKSSLNGQGAGHAGPPKVLNLKVPTCMTSAPRAPYAIHNGGPVPLHYFQLEYKRIDGAGLTANWRKWYPWMQYMQFMREH